MAVDGKVLRFSGLFQTVHTVLEARFRERNVFMEKGREWRPLGVVAVGGSSL